MSSQFRYNTLLYKLKHLSKIGKYELVVPAIPRTLNLLHFFYQKGLLFYYRVSSQKVKVILKKYPGFYFFKNLKIFPQRNQHITVNVNNYHHFLKKYGPNLLIISRLGILPLKDCFSLHVGGVALCSVPFLL